MVLIYFALSNQSILKEISPGCSLEGLRLKLKLQYFGHLMQRADSLEKTLMLGGIGPGGHNNSKRYMHPHAHYSTIYNSQDVQTT